MIGLLITSLIGLIISLRDIYKNKSNMSIASYTYIMIMTATIVSLIIGDILIFFIEGGSLIKDVFQNLIKLIN